MIFKCPHCGCANSVSADDLPLNDGEEKEFNCRKCSQQYAVEAYVTLGWSIKEGDE